MERRDSAMQVMAPAQGAGQYLTFQLGGEMFGLGILAIKEIIECGSLTVVPMMPAVIRGVINLRGAAVPVMDLAARFGRPPGAIGRRSCIVIVETGDAGAPQVVGVMVDAVSAVLQIDAADIEPAPGFGTAIRTEFIAGMGKVAGRFVILLDAGRVLSADDLSLLGALPALPAPAAAV